MSAVIREEERKAKFKRALDPILEPGDVVLVVCKDDSRCLLFGRDFKLAYVEGMLTPEHTFPQVMLAFKLLGEVLNGHFATCCPVQYQRVAAQMDTAPSQRLWTPGMPDPKKPTS